VLPQGVAFATLAGMPPEYGLYGAMLPAIVGALWGSSWHLVSGPTNATSLMVFATVSAFATPFTPAYVSLVLTLNLMVGLIKLGLGVARLGTLVNFISTTVVVGFTAGAGLLIISAQLRNFFGLAIAQQPSFLGALADFIAHIQETHVPTLVVGVATLAFNGTDIAQNNFLLDGTDATHVELDVEERVVDPLGVGDPGRVVDALAKTGDRLDRHRHAIAEGVEVGRSIEEGDVGEPELGERLLDGRFERLLLQLGEHVRAEGERRFLEEPILATSRRALEPEVGRNREGHEHHGEDRRVPERESPAYAIDHSVRHSSSSCARRYPAPRRVWISGSRPLSTLRRRRVTQTSIAFEPGS